MGTRWSRILELLIVSVNYILIGYALSNIAMLLQSNPLFILFYASEIWVTGLYWRRAAKLTGSKLLSTVLLVVCFALQIGMVYFAGRDGSFLQELIRPLLFRKRQIVNRKEIASAVELGYNKEIEKTGDGRLSIFVEGRNVLWHPMLSRQIPPAIFRSIMFSGIRSRW